MAGTEAAPSKEPPRLSRRYRWFVSVFLVFHLVSLAIFLGPTSEERVEALPSWLAEALLQTSRPIWAAGSPIVKPYFWFFNLTQDWRLFGPRPTRWTTAVDVIAFYPSDPDDPLSRRLWQAPAGDSVGARISWPDSSAVDPGRWVQDTISLPWGAAGRFPNFMHQRERRLAYNLGLQDFFESYGAIFARWQCSELRDSRGLAPDGVQVIVDWVGVKVPWLPPEERLPTYFMGGFTCPALLAVEVE